MNNYVVDSAVNLARQIANKETNIDPYYLCKLLGISIIDNYSLEKDGYLICSNGAKLIFASAKVKNLHRKKFIIAHEIGHFLLHQNQMYCCTDIGENSNQRINTPVQEKQANAFASELLLPMDSLVSYMPKNHISFSEISKIAGIFDVSMTMTAMKAINCSNTEEEILICYENNRLRWFVSSNSNIRSSQVPNRCPIELGKISCHSNTNGIWDNLYVGPVSQEIFNPYGNQYLVLLSGHRWNETENFFC